MIKIMEKDYEELFIHYGHEHFDPQVFHEVKNVSYRNKPFHGFWGCPIESKHSWRRWIMDSYYLQFYRLTTSALYGLKKGTKVLRIKSLADVREVFDDFQLKDSIKKFALDYEKLAAAGFDAVELSINDFTDQYFQTWDVDSLVVMNPDIILPIDGKEKTEFIEQHHLNGVSDAKVIILQCLIDQYCRPEIEYAIESTTPEQLEVSLKKEFQTLISQYNEMVLSMGEQDAISLIEKRTDEYAQKYVYRQ